MNLFKKSPPIDTTQVLTALARVVHPEQRRDLKHLDFIAQKNGCEGGECQREILVKTFSVNGE